MFKDIFNHAKRTYNPNKYQSAGVITIYDLLYGKKTYNKDGTINFNMLARKDIMQDIRDRWPDLQVWNLPFGMLYPFGCLDVVKIFKANYRLPDHVIGLHWYAGDTVSQEMNCTITADNWPKEPCTFTRYAERYRND
jgi:hypothetical protein